jgi:deazaflavin-dependent oxidoreductase (nitroreductase family)
MSTFDPGDIRTFNEELIEEFRANDGALSGGFAAVPMLLLTTTGAKTGRPHTIPIVYGRDGDRWFVIASKGGARTNPAWYHNVVAHPDVTVELPGETFAGRAEVADPATRDRLYAQQSAVMPQFTEYQQKTDRVIPVIVLSRT